MSKKESSSPCLWLAASVASSAAVAIFFGSFLGFLPSSTAANPAFFVAQFLGSLNVAFSTDGLWYELCSLTDIAQGLSNDIGRPHALFNPGADVDFTTTTDFEDLAAPAADIMEFTDQDRALAVDSLASVFFWHALAGVLGGSALRLILSSAMWRDII